MLEFRGITKRFPGVVALEDVGFSVAKAEVVAVIGENGAGKSTLMKILGGVHQPDSGQVLVEGRPVSFRDPGEALASGVRIIYQELSVLDNLDIASNIFLGREIRKNGLLNSSEMERRSGEILKRVGLKYSPKTMVSELSLAERQLVEIARALAESVKILVLDEPSSSLTLDETQRLLGLVFELKGEGVTILYISHRLDEVKQIADRVVALRDGKNAGELKGNEVNHDSMVRVMVGRDLEKQEGGGDGGVGQVRLALKGVKTARFPGETVGFEVCSGEVLGMAGLVGAGRSELARAVFGVDQFVEGSIEIDGKAVSIRHANDAINAGVYLVPEDRRGAGLVVEMGVRENVSLPSLKDLSQFGLIDRKRERELAESGVVALKVKTASIDTQVSTLSGGNQQKVVLARWIPRNPKVIIFDEPTRGIDVGAKAEIYRLMKELATQGVAIWMISSDMEEIFNVSDRIAVLHEGRLAGILNRDEATEEKVMKLAVGDSL